MATDVDVQYFSHLNGLTLGNNWGDLIRLLDKALVTGIDFTQITAASIDEQGDVHITLYAAHNAMLFQVVELMGFTPSSLNQKYRIKGVPNTTQLILKPAIDIAERSIIAIGAGKLASLGYDIIFRDVGDVKRVYRAKNPLAEHPFIRVDESLTSPDGTTGLYTSTYAKYAMVGLLENMDHIDDYENPGVLQLPLDSTDVSKNWKITGAGSAAIRGWSRWYWAMSVGGWGTSSDTTAPANFNRKYTLVGDKNAFYLLNQTSNDNNSKYLNGCGLFNTALKNDVIPNWFLMAYEKSTAASVSANRPATKTGSPLLKFNGDLNTAKFFLPRFTELSRIADKSYGIPITPSNYSGIDNLYPGSNMPALEIPFYDEQSHLRGSLPHIFYSGKNLNHNSTTTPILSGESMYICDVLGYGSSANAISLFYVGDLE